MSNVIKKFLQLEAASGIILIMAAMLAMILANTALAGGYQAFLDTPVQVRAAHFARGTQVYQAAVYGPAPSDEVTGAFFDGLKLP